MSLSKYITTCLILGLFRDITRTHQAQSQLHQGLYRIKSPIQLRIHHLQNPARAPPILNPINQNKLLRQRLGLKGPSPAPHLQQQSPEGKHVGTRRGLPRECKLRRQVSQRAHHARGVRILPMIHQQAFPFISESNNTFPALTSL